MSPNEAKAEQKMPELTIPKFNPIGQFDLQIDLNKGTANVTSSNGIGKANVTVNHPTEVIEVPSKPIIKKEVKYETKTEYLEKVVLFSLPVPTFHVPSVQIPKSVER
nr:MAG: hypothetical protein [Bacteriophage sp.]